MRSIHKQIVAQGLDTEMILNTLVSMYGKCGSLHEAKGVFRDMNAKFKCSITCNAIIAAYAQAGQCKEAFQAFAEMDLEGIAPDRITYMHLIEVCTKFEALDKGRMLQWCYEINGVRLEVIETALIKMYGRCGRVNEARMVFKNMIERDLVSWTTMLAVYAKHGHGKAAIKLFQTMDQEGVKPDAVAYSSVLDACGGAAAFSQGRSVHARVVQAGMEKDMILANCTMEMYGKCGRLEEARQVFDRMHKRDTVTWTTMIASYSENGYGKEGLELYSSFELEGGKPDEITLVTILAACSHSGLLSEGWQYFLSMRYDHGILAQGAHFGCVVDLLGRAGKLELAEQLMAENSSSFEWTSFMGACALHNDAARAQRASKVLASIDPKSSSGYIMFANVCNSSELRGSTR